MNFEFHHGNALEVLRGAEDNQFRCCVTSPPYFNLRSYLPDGELRETA